MKDDFQESDQEPSYKDLYDSIHCHLTRQLIDTMEVQIGVCFETAKMMAHDGRPDAEEAYRTAGLCMREAIVEFMCENASEVALDCPWDSDKN